jgi:hypothetical protein
MPRTTNPIKVRADEGENCPRRDGFQDAEYDVHGILPNHSAFRKRNQSSASLSDSKNAVSLTEWKRIAD